MPSTSRPFVSRQPGPTSVPIAPSPSIGKLHISCASLLCILFYQWRTSYCIKSESSYIPVITCIPHLYVLSHIHFILHLHATLFWAQTSICKTNALHNMIAEHLPAFWVWNVQLDVYIRIYVLISTLQTHVHLQFRITHELGRRSV